MAVDKSLRPTRADVGSAKVTDFGKRQIAIFNQHLLHGGESYGARNARLHVYGHFLGIKPLSNATMSPRLAFGERGRVFDRDSEWILWTYRRVLPRKTLHWHFTMPLYLQCHFRLTRSLMPLQSSANLAEPQPPSPRPSPSPSPRSTLSEPTSPRLPLRVRHGRKLPRLRRSLRLIRSRSAMVTPTPKAMARADLPVGTTRPGRVHWHLPVPVFQQKAMAAPLAEGRGIPGAEMRRRLVCSQAALPVRLARRGG